MFGDRSLSVVLNLRVSLLLFFFFLPKKSLLVFFPFNLFFLISFNLFFWGARTRIRDRQMHQQLKTDLVEHIWRKFGCDEDNK